MIRNRYNYVTPFVHDTMGKKDTLKATAPQSKHDKQKAKRTVSFKKNGQMATQRYTMTEIVNHNRSTALERSVKHYVGGRGVAITLALGSAVVYTRHLFSPREGFLTHQCNISEKIKKKIKQTQRRNNDEDSTARNNWNADAKENKQLDSGGSDQSQSIRYQPTYLKSL